MEGDASDNGINSPRNPSKNIICLSSTQTSRIQTLSILIQSTLLSQQINCSSSIKMQITQVITFLAVAVVGILASPWGPPPPHHPPPRPEPTSVVQQVFYGCHLLCYAALIPDL